MADGYCSLAVTLVQHWFSFFLFNLKNSFGCGCQGSPHALFSLGTVYITFEKSESISCSVVFDSLHPHELYSRPGSSNHGILQARILEWVVISFSRGSSRPRDRPWVSCIAGRFFFLLCESPGKPMLHSHHDT